MAVEQAYSGGILGTCRRRSVDWGTDLVAEGWSDVGHFSGSVEENCTFINSNLGC